MDSALANLPTHCCVPVTLVLEMLSRSFMDTRPCRDILSATCWCFLLVILLFQVAPKESVEVLSSVSSARRL